MNNTRILVTPDEAARMLRTSKSTIHDMLIRGEIPAFRSGRNWKIPKDLLIKTIEEKARKETDERRKAKCSKAT